MKSKILNHDSSGYGKTMRGSTTTVANVVATENRSAFVGTAPETFTYDLDGNLPQDDV